MTPLPLRRMLPWLTACGVLCAGTVSFLAAARVMGGDDPPKRKKPPAEKPAAKEGKGEKKQTYVRWGQQRKETGEQYDKRYAKIVRRVKKDDPDDKSGGPAPLYTIKDVPFIVRSDVSKEFTADVYMYMEKLHREYGKCYKELLGPIPSNIKEPIEVEVFESQATYVQNGGFPGSGGQFAQSQHFLDRGRSWPAPHYRLSQFTSGIKDFARWDKGTLKHEAAHMELQMRLGLGVDTPRWFNEGHATVFEYWDFKKTVEENLADVPNRGRYAPFIRRIHGTDRWKDFRYVWGITPDVWAHDMTAQDDQGFLNYAQAWSMACYMMCGGQAGHKDFRRIYDLSKTVGDEALRKKYLNKKVRSWEVAFPPAQRAQMEQRWNDWVAANVPRDKTVPDEEMWLYLRSCNPKVVDKLERLTDADTNKAEAARKKYLKPDPSTIFE